MNFVDDHDPDNVLIVSGDHVYHLDFSDLIRFHDERNADLTIVAKTLSPEKTSSRFGYINMDNDCKVTFFKEKPKRKISNVASLGIYLFKKEILRKALVENAATGTT